MSGEPIPAASPEASRTDSPREALEDVERGDPTVGGDT
jgi:hypothetical protein